MEACVYDSQQEESLGGDRPDTVLTLGRTERSSSSDERLGRMALVAGIFIILLGWVDILVGWFPTGFGSPEWEFGAVSATVDGLPFSTLGTALALLGATAAKSRRGLWVVSIWAIWVLAVLAVGSVFYALSVPVALGALGPEGLQGTLARAVVKTSTLIVLYVCFYGWMEYQAFRRLRMRQEDLDR